MGLVRSYVVAFCLAFATGCFAQWGDFGGFGGGGFGGFGGDCRVFREVC